MNKKTLYIDMDGVLADFGNSIAEHPLRHLVPYNVSPDLIPNIFKDLKPIVGAIDAVNQLIDSERFDIYILTTAPWDNPAAWMHKRLWIEEKFGDRLKKKIIIAHHKNLLKGDYLIDDRLANGAEFFDGEHIHFGWNYEKQSWNRYKDWETVLNYLLTV